MTKTIVALEKDIENGGEEKDRSGKHYASQSSFQPFCFHFHKVPTSTDEHFHFHKMPTSTDEHFHLYGAPTWGATCVGSPTCVSGALAISWVGWEVTALLTRQRKDRLKPFMDWLCISRGAVCVRERVWGRGCEGEGVGERVWGRGCEGEGVRERVWGRGDNHTLSTNSSHKNDYQMLNLIKVDQTHSC